MVKNMKKALIVAGGWDGHEPKQTSEVFSKILSENGFETEVSFSLDSFENADYLKTLDLIVPHWTMGTISSTAVKNVCAAVASGVGIAGCHGGMCDSFRESTEWQFMTGSQWVAHPGNAGITYEVNFNHSSASPLTEGLSDFSLTSEQYYIHCDPCVNVLATTRFAVTDFNEHSSNGVVTVPVIYTKYWGKGKVYYISVGHVAAVWDIPQAREAIRRGFIWAAK